MPSEKAVMDVASIGTIVATLVGLLPHLAALASLIWSCIRIYETQTVQKWLDRFKKPKET
jgi:hypothetical protein